MEVAKLEKKTRRTSLINLLTNIVLSTGKLIAGIFSRSQALIASSLDSISDVISTGLVNIGIRKSQKAPDENHPFGHERVDNATAIVLAILFFLTGAFIIYNAILTIVDSATGEIVLKAPTRLAWITTLIAIVIKLALYFYTVRVAAKSASSSLKGLSTDHLLDVIAMSITLIGVTIAVELDIPLLDPIISLITGLLLIYNGVKTIIDALNRLVDRSAPKEVIEQIERIIKENKGVRSIDNLRTRLFGNKIYIEVEISVDGKLTVLEGHEIANDVHNEIESQISNIKHVMVHVNPDQYIH